MNTATAFPSKYIKAAEVEQDVTYTIATVKVESLGQGADAEDKWVVYFEETDKGLVLNKTNLNTIADLCGTETDDWPGKSITLGYADVAFQGKQVASVRVRTRTARQAPPASRPAPAAARPPSSTAATGGASPAMGATAAFRAFTTATPSLTAAQRQSNYAAALAEKFPEKAKADLTEADWDSFKDDIAGSYDEATAGFLSY